MYNKEIKERFIRESARDAHNYARCVSIFNKTQQSEERLEKDLAEMSMDELADTLKECHIRNGSSFTAIRSLLALYVEWCAKEGVLSTTIQNEIRSIPASQMDFSEQFQHFYFRDEVEMLDALHLVLGDQIWLLDFPALCLTWLGLTRNEILTLKDSQVDLDAGMIFDSEGKVVVQGFPKRINEHLKDYAKCRTGYRPNGKTSYSIIKDMTLDTFIKRFHAPTSDKFGSPLTMPQLEIQNSDTNRLYTELGNPPRLLMSNVWKAGRFHALYQLEKAGIDPWKKENIPIVCAVMRDEKGIYRIRKRYADYKTAFGL